MLEHFNNCKNNEASRVTMPKEGSKIKFTNYNNTVKKPFVMITDFESMIVGGRHLASSYRIHTSQLNPILYLLLLKMTKKKAVKKAAKKTGKKSVSSSSSSSSTSHKEMTPKQKPKATSGSPPSPKSSLKKEKKARGSDDNEPGEYDLRKVQWNLVVNAEKMIKDKEADLKKANDKLNECVAKDDFKSNAYKHWKEQIKKLEASIKRLEGREASYRESANKVQAKMSAKSYKLSASIPGWC